MGDLNYDDGLVHGHLWASEPLGRPSVRREASPARLEIAARSDEAYDDGLVHDHSWARSN